MISVKKIIKNKNILKKLFFQKHNFLFLVTMCIYINTEYWPERSFKAFLFTEVVKRL